MSIARSVATLVALVALFPLPLLAQDNGSAAAPDQTQATPAQPGSEEPVPAPLEPWDIPFARLRAQLQPLFVDEIEQEVAKWMDYLRYAVQETSSLRLEGVSGARLADASAHKNAIADRLEVVLDAWEAKGGDAKEQKAYLVAVGGADLDPADVNAVWDYVRAWVVRPDGGIKVALNIVKFFVVLFLFWLLSKLVARVVSLALRRTPKAKPSQLLQEFLVGGVQRTVMVIGLIVAVTYLGVNITPLIAAIGAAGLVIGLALQGTLSNFASGLLILIYRPYDVGDVISGGGVTGKVENMNLVSTRIATFDNQVMLVPNNEIWNGVITNITARGTRRVDLKIGISYNADIDRAEQAIREVVTSHEKVLAEPALNIQVNELGDNSVNLIVRPWANTSDYWEVYWDLMRRIKQRLDKEGIGIPYPQRDLTFSGPVEVLLKQPETKA